LKRHIEADFLPVFETLGHGFGAGGNMHKHTLDQVRLHSLVKRGS
jgi:hypothetical protein